MDPINDFDCDGYRPIHHAILAHAVDRATELIALGANVNAPTESGDGSLVLLCRALKDSEACEWVDLLIEWGAVVEAVDRKGWTALHHAADRNLILTATRLLRSGSDPLLKNLGGMTSFDLVRSSEMKAVFEGLAR